MPDDGDPGTRPVPNARKVQMKGRIVLATLAVTLLAIPVGCEQLSSGRPTGGAVKRLLDTYAEARNTGNLHLLDGIMDSGVVVFDPGFSEPLTGLAVVKLHYVGMQSAFPDLHLEFGRTEAAGDRIITDWTLTGTHAGPLGEIEPTGRRISISGTSVSTVRGGRIVEDRVFYDALNLYLQLGFELVPGGSP